MITRTQPQKTLATFLENPNQSLEILQLFQANNPLKCEVCVTLDIWRLLKPLIKLFFDLQHINKYIFKLITMQGLSLFLRTTQH